MPYDEAMANSNASQAVEKIAQIVGSQAALARHLDVSAPTVNQWVKGIKPIPTRHCVKLEKLSGGQVTRCDLRPDDWRSYWPDLVAEATHA